MCDQRKTCAETAILADQLGEHNGIETAGHTGDDQHHGQQGMQAAQTAKEDCKGWNQRQSYGGKQIGFEIQEEILRLKGSERQSR